MCAVASTAVAGPAQGGPPPPPPGVHSGPLPAAPPLQYPYPVYPVEPTAPGVYPAVPCSLPPGPAGKLAEPELTPYAPKLEPSPVNSNTSTKPTKPNVGAKAPRALSASSADPQWRAALADHSKKVRSCQKELDKILSRHGFNWVELSKDPNDRQKCEEILKLWSQSESTLQEAYRVGKPPVPVTLPKTPLSREELNAADIGR
jgi:hypothetical protein